MTMCCRERIERSDATANGSTKPSLPSCEELMREGMLCKDTHEQVMRLAPPLSITRDEIDWALTRLQRVLS
ncbi:MAG: hypothetical protein JSU86_11755 [Phycisphaerales bacterium]|nr:MAG: hypothetical protein JSU86_11755 [Phycisphaerales bacterium]